MTRQRTLNEKLPVDNVTGSLIEIHHSLNSIHEGNHFFTKGYINLDGAGTIGRFMFTTPDNGDEVHAKAILSANAEFLIEIWEGITTSDDGTPVATFCNNRILDETPKLKAYASPTVTDEGTLIWSTKVGDGKAPSGVSPALGYEIIAKKNTKYMFKITKVASSEHYVDYDFFWEEHTPLNANVNP